MEITNSSIGSIVNNMKNESSLDSSKTGFMNALTDHIGSLNDGQLEAEKLTLDVVNGKSDNAHNALIALSKAEIQLSFTKKTTELLISAYQDTVNMQI